MSDTTPSAARKALDYAEKELGVNSVYFEAQSAAELLNDAHNQLIVLRGQKRIAEDAIASREMDIVIEESGKHSGMSVAAMERHLKQVFHQDSPLSSLRLELSGVVSRMDSWEYSAKTYEADIRVATARMNELGGYLAYLAATKRVQTPVTAQKPGDAE